MPDSWLTYDPFEQIVVSPELPKTRNGVLTFGTLNNPYKFTRQGVELWADVMRQVSDSRFLSVHPEHKNAIVAANLTIDHLLQAFFDIKCPQTVLSADHRHGKGPIV